MGLLNKVDQSSCRKSLTLVPDMHFLEVLQEGLERVLMIRGTGREVITMYN